MKHSENYLRQCAGVVAAVAAQKEAIDTAADWFAESILKGRVVHLFGSGHSPDHGGGDVATLRLLPGMEPDRGALAHLP